MTQPSMDHAEHVPSAPETEEPRRKGLPSAVGEALTTSAAAAKGSAERLAGKVSGNDGLVRKGDEDLIDAQERLDEATPDEGAPPAV